MLFLLPSCSLFFFFNDTATTEIYTLSLHDALPISVRHRSASSFTAYPACELGPFTATGAPPGHSTMRPPITSTNPDRKSTRLNSSHSQISYAVFCLKKKKKTTSLSRLQRPLDNRPL